MVSTEPRSFAATSSMSAPCWRMARKKFRPMRPKPLIPTRIAMFPCTFRVTSRMRAMPPSGRTYPVPHPVPPVSGRAERSTTDRMALMEAATARVIWRGLEHLHAVTYFAPECRDAPAALGLRGFWRGYFAGRAAPIGAVPAGVVEATFFNFHPTMVRNAVPAVWDVAPPSQLVRARATGAAAALRRVVPDVEQVAGDLMPLLEPCIAAA